MYALFIGSASPEERGALIEPGMQMDQVLNVLQDRHDVWVRPGGSLFSFHKSRITVFFDNANGVTRVIPDLNNTRIRMEKFAK
jgi:hypothetical protein